VTNTSQILCFKILSESGVSAGVRRIEALTGRKALQYLNLLAEQALSARRVLNLNSPWDKMLEDQVREDIAVSVEKLDTEIKILKKEIQSLKGSQVDVNTLMKDAKEFRFGDITGRWLFADTELDDRKVLSELSDQLRDKLSPSVVVLMGRGENTHHLLVSVSKELSS
jgi:alanyl-tRNA synthetase